MRPKLDHKVIRTHAYRTAKESCEPGYLAAGFRAIRAEQARQAGALAARALAHAAKAQETINR